MTHDGAVSVNLVTGETTYPSDRTPEQDHSVYGDTAGAAGKAVERAELHREQAAAKKKRRKQRKMCIRDRLSPHPGLPERPFMGRNRAYPHLSAPLFRSRQRPVRCV